MFHFFSRGRAHDDSFTDLFSFDPESCDCQVPCSQIKYTTEVSHSKFPDQGTAEMMVLAGYYDNVQYQR